MPGTISTSATTTLLSKDTEWGQKTESETGLVEKAGRKYVSAGVTGKIGDRKFLSAWSVAQTKKQEGGLAITEKAGRKRIQPDSGRLAKSEDKKRTKPVTKPNVSSFVVFNEFVTHDKETDKYDATEVLSMECYQRWLQTRQKRPKMPEESFRRAITAHVRGADGRRPFSAEVETAILKELRKKGCWKCFSRESTIGKLGYKKYGYHEEERMRKEYGCADLVTKKKHNKTKKQSVATKARKSFMKIKESLLESKSEASSPVQKVFANSNTNDNMEKKTADNNTASASTTVTQLPQENTLNTTINILPAAGPNSNVLGGATMPSASTTMPVFSNLGMYYQMVPHLQMPLAMPFPQAVGVNLNVIPGISQSQTLPIMKTQQGQMMTMINSTGANQNQNGLAFLNSSFINDT